MSYPELNDSIKLMNGEIGIVRYIGPIDKKVGTWVGLELDEPNGTHDGSLDKKFYFRCKPNHGIFVKRDKLTTRMIKLTNSEGTNAKYSYDSQLFNSSPGYIHENKDMASQELANQNSKEYLDKYKTLLQETLAKSNVALDAIQNSLSDLQLRVNNLLKLKKAEPHDKTKILDLASEIIFCIENGNPIDKLYLEYKDLMKKRNIDVDKF